MTAAELLALICAAILFQLAVWVGWTVWQHRAADSSALPTPLADARLQADAHWAGWREFRVVQRCFEDSAKSQCSFYLEPLDGQALAAFKPGQFLTFALKVTARASDGSASTTDIRRCYSLSDQPDSGHYRVTIKRVPAPIDHPEFEPGLSSRHFHDHVQVGDLLRVKAPAGRFFIDPDPNVPVVLIGAGIGITPMMSMLRWCLDHQPQRRVHLYYGLRNRREQAFKAVLEGLGTSHPALTLNVVYSRPGESDVLGRDYQHAGHVDVGLLRRTLPQGRHHFYVCGPSAMLQTLVPALADWGVPVGDIHFEAFGPASVQWSGMGVTAAPAVAGLEVRFGRSGRTLIWDGQDATLLDFAERHSIAVESGCRSGSCGSCETRLLEGSVRYEHTPDHDVAQGHCLLCVGRPSTSLVLEV